MPIKRIKYFNFVFLLLFSSLSFAETADNKLEFSGFARIILGSLGESNATYLGYDNGFSFTEQSLIALQADYQISHQLSATAQVIAYTGDDRDSGVEWLYLTYQPNRFTQIKLGRQRTPFFNYSDVIDVGFSYPWITLPQQVYSVVYFSTFDGVLAGYEWNVSNVQMGVEAFWGSFNGDVSSGGITIPANVNDTQGFIFNLSYDNFTFRTAYHRADVFLTIDELSSFSETLSQFGFNESAESLNPDGEIKFYQAGVTYENLKYFLRSEYTQIDAESSIVPRINSFYVAAGYNYSSYSSYISYGKTNSRFGDPINEVPFGVNDSLNALSIGYDIIFSELDFDSSESITIGTRWDYKSNLALKAEVTWIRSDGGSTANFNQLNDRFDNKAPLYQLALDWVF